MIAYIETIEIGGGTNFYAGFESAYNLLKSSDQMEFVSGCNRAFLFLTDGEMTAPLTGFGSTADDVHNYIND